MAFVFAKLAPNIRRHPKCRKAGRDGTDVFVHVLCVNAERGATGVVPAAYIEPWFIRDEVQFETDEQAADGLRRAVEADLIEILQDGSALIVGWDEEEWGRSRDSESMTEAERKRLSREKKREQLRAEASKRPDKEKPVRTASGRPDYAESEKESDQSQRQSQICGTATPAAKSDHRAVTDAFQAAYLAQTGEKPTWGAKQGKQAAALLKTHGRVVVLERIGRLFDGSIDWLRPPFDFGTLVQHFDKLAPVANGQRAGPRGHNTAASVLPGLLDHIAELEAAERERPP